ncbi:biotin synthase BioB [Asticcacaulis excentricus]|uniref:Biotin synthase n=1 Tax=Asticcacaulis excentricus (strain ATCC 15261 / DSM 4724 / KCTC 12464 / NCIMB 9791 / VKM B-1370 / CB 48) TaxID=573065 RepID=E8RMM6_ASTEC|nr:biotin synthase BioB [Asticcacaulis excentricus]ADU13907.1 biotin synthase [Asticcacaulis excentricus CB 48]
MPDTAQAFNPVRHDWTKTEIAALFELPFMELVYKAASVHRQSFDPSEIQLSQLLSIKTGGCAENCGYCSQSAHHNTGLKASKLMPVDEVLSAAKAAREGGAQRFCMGAAWRDLKDRDVPALAAMISEVKALGLETCATLGMITADQATALKSAGLDYYNHNLDTSPEYYDQVVTTRTYDERLETLKAVRDVGMKTCCGGILGMGESREDRVSFLQQLANLPSHPDSLPINNLVPVANTPLGERSKGKGEVSPIEFVRTVAVARIVCPKSMVRLSAGRNEMSEELQALCFLAGANSIFVGNQLLTTPNPEPGSDAHLMQTLGLRPMS